MFPPLQSALQGGGVLFAPQNGCKCCLLVLFPQSQCDVAKVSEVEEMSP